MSGSPREVAEPWSAARWLGAFMVAGGACTLVFALTVPGHAGRGVMPAVMLTLGVALVLLGAATARWGGRVPAAILSLGGPAPVLLIGAMNLATEDSSTGSQLFLLLPVIFAASFLGLRLNALVLAEAVAVEAVVLGTLEPAATAAATTATVGITFALTMGTILTFRRRVERALAALGAQASEDALTGLANRRAFDEGLGRSVAVANRTGAPLSLMLVDVDRFKEVNDADGHREGDRALRAVAEALRAATRAADTAARVGGDEFAVLLPGCSVEQAAGVAEAVARRVRAVTDGRGRRLTLSTGVATLPDAAATGEGLFAAADHALYRAKADGRDRVAAAVTGGARAAMAH